MGITLVNEVYIDDYPGRTIRDEDRSPLGLGWEYRRRGWKRGQCPLPRADWDEFFLGYDEFICTNPEANEAMLKRGVPVDLP